jgi:hypothetical protein
VGFVGFLLLMFGLGGFGFAILGEGDFGLLGEPDAEQHGQDGGEQESEGEKQLERSRQEVESEVVHGLDEAFDVAADGEEHFAKRTFEGAQRLRDELLVALFGEVQHAFGCVVPTERIDLIALDQQNARDLHDLVLVLELGLVIANPSERPKYVLICPTL